VRKLAAATGDGWLGSVGSPGQLETSLNSGYIVGPCNSYLEGPTLVLWPLIAPLAYARSARIALCSCRSELQDPLLISRASCRIGWPAAV
jgi:hypothetical protein